LEYDAMNTSETDASKQSGGSRLESMAAAPAVYVIEDDAAVNRLLVAVATRLGYESRGFASVPEFWSDAQTHRPGCVICDVVLPGPSGLDLLAQFADRRVSMPVILVTGQASIPLCVSAMQRGAFQFLEKPLAGVDISSDVSQAISLSRKRMACQVEADRIAQIVAELSDDEQATLELLAAGKANKQIAAQLDLSLRTVQFRITALVRKFGVESRTALVNLLVLGGGETTWQRVDPPQAACVPWSRTTIHRAAGQSPSR
jgi:FixJ family two-component response regulator